MKLYPSQLRLLFSLALLLSLLSFLSSCKPKEEVYLFSSFRGNGADGLHLAYSKDGYTWNAIKNDSSLLRPDISEDKLMRDPCIIKGNDNKFHMVWTVSWTEKGIGYASSEDLIHWSEQQYLPVMEHEPTTRNTWAPEIYYDDNSAQYIIYWASTIPDRFNESDSSSEIGYNHRMYFTTTKDFVNFSETKLLYDQGFSVIDAVITKKDNEYLMILKDETRYPKPEKNFRIARSQQLDHGYSKPGKIISPEGIWVEGPTIAQVDDAYIIYYDMYRDHRMGAIKSYDLENWYDISDSISFPKGTRHGSVFKVHKSTLQQLLEQ